MENEREAGVRAPAEGLPEQGNKPKPMGQPRRRAAGTKRRTAGQTALAVAQEPGAEAVEGAGQNAQRGPGRPPGRAARREWAGIVATAAQAGRLEDDAAPLARSFARQIDRMESCLDGAYRRMKVDGTVATPDWLDKMGKAEKQLADLRDRLAAMLAGGGRFVLEGFPPPPLQEEDDHGL